MKKTSNAIRFETRVPLREVMNRRLTTTGIEATVAKAAKAMCHDQVGSVIILDHNKPIGTALPTGKYQAYAAFTLTVDDPALDAKQGGPWEPVVVRSAPVEITLW